MQGCSLSCKGSGLSHLFSPIITRASKVRNAQWLHQAAAPGVLKVVETKIRVRLGPDRPDPACMPQVVCLKLGQQLVP